MKISTSLLFLESAICVALPFHAWVVMEFTPKEKGILDFAAMMMGSQIADWSVYTTFDVVMMTIGEFRVLDLFKERERPFRSHSLFPSLTSLLRAAW